MAPTFASSAARIYPDHAGPRLGKRQMLCPSLSSSCKCPYSSPLADMVLDGCKSRFMTSILASSGEESDNFPPNTIHCSTSSSESSATKTSTVFSWTHHWVDRLKTSSSGPGRDDSMKALGKFSYFLDISTMASAHISAAGGRRFLVGGFCGCSLEEKKTLSHAKTIRYISPYAYGSSRL